MKNVERKKKKVFHQVTINFFFISPQLNVKNKEITQNIDQQLSRLNAEIRKPIETKAPVETEKKDRSAKIREEIRKFNETEKNCVEALDRLISMEM